MTTWCPCALKSPCLLSAHLVSLAGCRWTGRCSTDLAQLRGIFSSPVEVLWRMHLESQHWCKHLVTTTLGQLGHNLCISLPEEDDYNDDQNISAMSRNEQNVAGFLENVHVQFVKLIFLEKACLRVKRTVFLLSFARMHSWSDMTCNHKRALFPLKISLLLQKARDMPYKFANCLRAVSVRPEQPKQQSLQLSFGFHCGKPLGSFQMTEDPQFLKGRSSAKTLKISVNFANYAAFGDNYIKWYCGLQYMRSV